MAKSHQKLLPLELTLMILLSVCMLNFPRATLAADQCQYAFNVPTAEGGCPGQGVLEQKVKDLEETVKAQRDQIGSIMSQQTTLLKEFTAKTSEMCTKQQQCLESAGGTAGVTEQSLSSSSTGSGITYTRWGRTTCRAEATALYKGYAASSHHNEGYGGGVSYLCLPETPQWANNSKGGIQGYAKLYGVEYELFADNPFSTSNNGGQPLAENDAPCVSCYVPTRSTKVMIPARLDCPSGWTKEYGGFLVTSHHGHQNGREHVCLDQAPEVTDGGAANINPSMFYHVEVPCGGGLPCPKYVDGYEIACVVCSK